MERPLAQKGTMVISTGPVLVEVISTDLDRSQWYSLITSSVPLLALHCNYFINFVDSLFVMSI